VGPTDIARAARRTGRGLRRRIALEADLVRTRSGRADLAVLHELAPPPAGGGHQFVRALVRELESRGLAVELNRVSAGTPACLFNSFNFDLARLRRFAERGARMVHRVDGPIGAYRGFDDGTDAWIANVNAELAAATIFQSRYSLERHRELGFELREPVVIPNAVDPAIFHPPASREPLEGRRARLVATSWSDNPRKGGETLAWLDRNLDHRRFEVTFAGRPPGTFEHVRVVGPLDSSALASLLRTQDLYLAPSHDDPCSNALIEALACGLPAAFRESGGHPELVGDAGLPFRRDDELGDVLDRLVAELDRRRASISTHPIAWVADRYLEVLGVRGAA
jgi:glycosyltransferase involved in cell wall biosynthesis